MDLSRLMRVQKAYQLRAFGIDWDALRTDPDELTGYVTTMLNAAFLEVAEVQQEVPWKPWAKVDRAAVWASNRDKVVAECVDVVFFIANVLGAAGCTDAELAERYAAKMRVNERRQATGYDGVTDKCGQCGRALDEPGATSFTVYRGKRFCTTAHAHEYMRVEETFAEAALEAGR